MYALVRDVRMCGWVRDMPDTKSLSLRMNIKDLVTICAVWYLVLYGAVPFFQEWRADVRRREEERQLRDKWDYPMKLLRWRVAASEQLVGCNRSATGVVRWSDLCPSDGQCSIAPDLHPLAEVTPSISENELRQGIPHCERLTWKWGKRGYDMLSHDMAGRDMVCMHFQAGYCRGPMRGGSWEAPRKLSMWMHGHTLNISMTFHPSWSGQITDAQPLDAAVRVRYRAALGVTPLHEAEGMWSPIDWTVAMTCCPANMFIQIPADEWHAGCRRSCAYEEEEQICAIDYRLRQCAECEWRRKRSMWKYGCVASES